MKASSLFLVPLFAAPVWAQDATPTPAPDEPETTFVITAERNPRPLSETVSTITVIGRDQLEAKKTFDLADAIRLAPGISLSQSGSRGKSTSIFSRGTNSNHTLVLIDGIRANNPSDGRFDFGQIPVENIERIEVLRGPQSALYGSDALGGVINIISRRGDGDFRTGFQTEFGNQSTNRQVATANGAWGKTRLSFSASRLASDGLFENDEYRDNGASLRLDRELNARQNLTFNGRLSAAKFGVPGQQTLSFDPFQGDRSRDLNYSLRWTNQSGKRRDQLTAGVYDRYLRDDDTRDPSGFGSFSTFKNKVRTLEAQTAFSLGKNTLTAGIEERRETVDSQASFGGYTDATKTRALFLQNEFRSGRLALVPGVRRERNSQFGGFTSYRMASAYEIADKTRLKATFGTAFKAPAFDSLYFPGFGNPNLRPERSKGGEFGIERQFSGGGRFEATLFQNQIRDLIGGFPISNINRARTRGLELSLDQPLPNGMRVVLNQTFTRTRSSAGSLLRRPSFNTAADLIARRGKWNYDLGVLAQGRRTDNVFTFDPVTFASSPNQSFGGYARLDFTLGHQIRPGVEIYARAQNLLNKRYEEAAGFRAPGFNVVFGVKTAAF